MTEGVTPPLDLGRALQALSRSGRRLVRRASGWAVIGGTDGRARAIAELDEPTARRLLESGSVRPAAGGGYVLGENADVGVAPGPGVVAAAGHPRSRRAGAGFAHLAQQAAAGEGPLSLRQALAGVRLTADVEAAMLDRSLSMTWDGMPGPRGRKGGGRAARGSSTSAAQARLRRVRAGVGEFSFELARAACIDGRTLADLEVRYGLARRSCAEALAHALERLADAYER